MLTPQSARNFLVSTISAGVHFKRNAERNDFSTCNDEHALGVPGLRRRVLSALVRARWEQADRLSVPERSFSHSYSLPLAGVAFRAVTHEVHGDPRAWHAQEPWSMATAELTRPSRTTHEPEREPEGSRFQYPGIPTTCDGAEAVVWVETRISQGSGAFPITSSTTMGGGFNAAVMNGIPNLWGDQLVFIEPESEHSAATFCEGFAVAGGRVTNFTSGQGLVLMKEVLYTISGKRLPVVFNIGARRSTSQGLNVHAGHDDVMSVADCGWGMLFAPQRAGSRRPVPDRPPRRRERRRRRSSTCRTASSRRTPSKACGCPSRSS